MKQIFVAFFLLILLAGCQDSDSPYVVEVTASNPIIEVFSNEPNWTDYLVIEGEDAKIVIDSLQFDASDVDFSELSNSYIVTYTYLISENERASGQLIVSIVDTTEPNIILEGELIIDVTINQEFTDPGYQITDNFDVSILQSNIEIISDVDTSILGTYYVTYRATDESGNIAEIIRTVNVIDNIYPVITINGEQEITHTLGEYYQDELAQVEDNYDDDIDLVVQSDYNPFLVGVYTITYLATDQSGNQSRVDRTVQVLEPEISSAKPGLYQMENFEDIAVMLELQNGDLLLLGSNANDGVIRYLNADHTTLWESKILQTENEDVRIYDAIINNLNQIVIVGDKYYTPNKLGFIATYDLSGNLLNYKQTELSENKGYNKIVQLGDGNYLLNEENGNTAFSIVKMDTLFNEVWHKTYQKNCVNKPVFVESNNGNITVYSGFYGSLDIYVLDQLGNELSSQSSYVGGYIRDIIVTEDNIYLANETGLYVVYDDIHQYTFMVDDIETTITSLALKSDGNLVISGDMRPANNYDAVVIQIDDTYSIVASMVISGSDDEKGWYTESISNNRIITWGWTHSSNNDFEHFSSGYSGFYYICAEEFSQIEEPDHTPPTIELNGSNVVNLQLNDTYTEMGAIATDQGVTLDVTVISDVNPEIPGLYEVYYITTDSSGNSNLIRRTVNVYETLTENNTYIADLYSLTNEDNDLFDILSIYDYNNDYYITQNEINTVNKLSVFNQDVPNLKYISQFVGLTELILIDNQLDSIDDISQLSQLTSLTIANNNISDISEISLLTSLTTLVLTNNKISDVSDLNNLNDLSVLNVSSNPIIDLDQLGTLPNLTHLSAYSCNISSYTSADKYPNLKELFLSENNISTISNFNNPQLEKLNLVYNDLENLDGLSGLVNSPNLTQLMIGYNPIVSYCGISSVTQLKELDVSNNISINLQCLASLINLEYINFVNTSVEEEDVLSNYTKLTHLMLGSSVKSYSFLNDLPSLVEIYVILLYRDTSVLTNNREALEAAINRGVQVNEGNIINLFSIDQGIASVLSSYDHNNDTYINLYEAHDIKILDLSNVDVHSLYELDDLYSLETLTVKTTYLNLLPGSIDSQVIANLQNHGVTVNLIN